MDLEGMTEKRNRNGTIYFQNFYGELVAKFCTKCCVLKGIEEYSKRKESKDGYTASCKVCNSKYNAENKERFKERNRLYRIDNREDIAERTKRWRNENQEHVAEYDKKRRVANKEFYDNYYKENRDLLIERMKKWQKENPEKVILRRHRRDARKAMLPDTLTTEEYSLTLEYFGNACALTGATESIEKEHAIPLSIGHGGTTFGNCYPMVNGLNQAKGNRNIFEWFEANRQRFELSQEKFDRLIDYLASANAMTVEEYQDFVYWCHENPRYSDENKAQ